MNEMALFTGLDSGIRELRRKRDLTDSYWRFQIGDLVNRTDQEYRLREEEESRRRGSGVATRAARTLGVNKSSISQFRKFSRLFAWHEIREFVENGFSWVHFKAVLNCRYLDDIKQYMRTNPAPPKYVDFIARMKGMNFL